MPVPFNRLRLLNGSSKDVTGAKYARSGEAGTKKAPTAAPNPNPDELQDEQTVPTPVAKGTLVDHVPTSIGYYDVKTIGITLMTLQGGKELPLWQLFYPEDPFDPEANVIVEVDLYVQDAPDAGAFYAMARVTYHDGTVWDYFSPLFS
jgi:hypothetical protein